jgi:hypothetical protein
LEAELKDIYRSIKGREDLQHISNRIASLSDRAMKMKLIRRSLRKSGEEWRTAVEEMGNAELSSGFHGQMEAYDDVDCPEADDQWRPVQEDIDERIKKAWGSVQKGLELVSESVARWDWYVRMKEAAKGPVSDQWKRINPIQWRLDSRQNLRKDMPQYGLPDEGSDDHVPELRCWNSELKKVEYDYPVIDGEDWNDKSTQKYLDNWVQWASAKRSGVGRLTCLHVTTWELPRTSTM